jgi:hypothetical protein
MGEKAFVSNRDAAVKIGLMPWLNGLVFALGVITVLFVMLSQFMQPLWQSGSLLGPLDVQVIEYAVSYVTVTVLLYILQYRLTQEPDDDEPKKRGSNKRGREKSERRTERGALIRG